MGHKIKITRYLGWNLACIFLQHRIVYVQEMNWKSGSHPRYFGWVSLISKVQPFPWKCPVCVCVCVVYLQCMCVCLSVCGGICTVNQAQVEFTGTEKIAEVSSKRHSAPPPPPPPPHTHTHTFGPPTFMKISPNKPQLKKVHLKIKFYHFWFEYCHSERQNLPNVYSMNTDNPI